MLWGSGLSLAVAQLRDTVTVCFWEAEQELWGRDSVIPTSGGADGRVVSSPSSLPERHPLVNCVWLGGPCPGENVFYWTVCSALCVTAKRLDAWHACLPLHYCLGWGTAVCLTLEGKSYGTLTYERYHRERTGRRRERFWWQANIPSSSLVSHAFSVFRSLSTKLLPTPQGSHGHHKPHISEWLLSWQGRCWG